MAKCSVKHLCPVSTQPLFCSPFQRQTPSRITLFSNTLICNVTSSNNNTNTNTNVWVNPNTPPGRASRLRNRSYESRYNSLVQLALTLDSFSDPTPLLISSTLSAFRPRLLEQDAVILLNHVSRHEVALLVLSFCQENVELVREVVLYNVTLKVLRKCREFEIARQVFDEMLQRGVCPDNVTFSTLISCARVCNLPQVAVELFEKMSEFGCYPDDVTYSAMIDAYGRTGDVDRALSLYDRARAQRWRIDAVTFSTLIRIYGKTGNYDGCLNMYEEMKALGVKPNLVIYNTLLDAMGRAKRPWQAKNIYKEMSDAGIEPTWGTYVALLRAFCRVRYGQDAIKVYNEMKAKGLGFNLILYNTLLAMCADVAYVDEAVSIYNTMKSSKDCNPDSWSFSSMVTMYSCNGRVREAENMLTEMVEAGFEPNIYVFTSLIQCYGKANQLDDVVRTFNRVLELGIVPDDRFCGCLLNVMTQTPKEDLRKLLDCVEKGNVRLGNVVKILLGEESGEGEFKAAVFELFDTVSEEVKKPYCNCLIDLCVNLNLLDKACELLDMGLTSGIYTDIQSRTPTQWSLHLKSLSLGAALTSLHVWMNDLKKAVETGEELPPLLGINTGHGKHKYSESGLAGVFEAHLKDLNAPFHEAPDKPGWFLTTKVAVDSWLESQKSTELISS